MDEDTAIGDAWNNGGEIEGNNMDCLRHLIDIGNSTKKRIIIVKVS